MTMTTSTPSSSAPTTDAEAIASSANWRDAVRDLIGFVVERQRQRAEGGDPEPQTEDCLSSGGIVAVLRTHRMSDLRFSATNLGGYLRDLFDGDNMGKYLIDDGFGDLEEVSPLQVSRITVGKGRTPAGQLVFVYGPTQEICDEFDFEVDIPIPPGHTPRAPQAAPVQAASQGGYPTAVSAQAPGGYPTSIAAVVNPTPAPAPAKPVKTTPAGRMPSGTQEVKVIADCRAVVYRSVLDAWFHHSGKSMRAGDEVFLEFKADGKCYISLDESDDASAYRLTGGTRPGRIFFSSPTTPFTPDARYAVELTDDALVIDLNTAL